jgi:hypothetical protein
MLSSFLHNFRESQDSQPEIFKAKEVLDPWPKLLTELDETVIRER